MIKTQFYSALSIITLNSPFIIMKLNQMYEMAQLMYIISKDDIKEFFIKTKIKYFDDLIKKIITNKFL